MFTIVASSTTISCATPMSARISQRTRLFAAVDGGMVGVSFELSITDQRSLVSTVQQTGGLLSRDHRSVCRRRGDRPGVDTSPRVRVERQRQQVRGAGVPEPLAGFGETITAT